MALFKIAEKFISINGEGLRAGQPAAFIRFAGCGLRCSYCDTSWAWEESCTDCVMTEEEIFEYIRSSKVTTCTLTGGEPVQREGFDELCKLLLRENFPRTEIETNGAVYLGSLAELRRGNEDRLVFTLDYKLPSSGMEEYMLTENYRFLAGTDSVKFVCKSREDLIRAGEVIKEYDLSERCETLFSPVFGKIEPSEIVDFILENKLMKSRVQLQLHKFIWDPSERGV